MNVDGQGGPRDWSPDRAPRYGERAPGGDLPVARPRRRRARGFTLGVLLSLLVVPVAIAAWLLLRELGWFSVVVPWGAAVLAGVLYRWGSGGTLSRRGAWAIVVVTAVTVLACVAAGPVLDVLRGRIDAAAALDPATWWRELALGGVFALIGVLPVLWPVVTGRPFTAIAGVLTTIVGLAVAIALTQVLPSLTTEAPLLADGGLAVGDCFDAAAPEVLGVIEDPERPTLIPCDRPHFAQVVHVGRTDGRAGAEGAFPGMEWLSMETAVQCEPTFEAFVGIPATDSALLRYMTFPNEEAWRAGYRTLMCAVYDPAGPITGSLEGTAR